MFDPYHKWLGIPRGQRPPTHYQLLGLAAGEDDPEVIEEAAIRQTTHLRTYQIGPHGAECTRLLNEVSEARTTLLNPAKRRAYDARLTRQAAAPAKPAAEPANNAAATGRGVLIGLVAGGAVVALLLGGAVAAYFVVRGLGGSAPGDSGKIAAGETSKGPGPTGGPDSRKIEPTTKGPADTGKKGKDPVKQGPKDKPDTKGEEPGLAAKGLTLQLGQPRAWAAGERMGSLVSMPDGKRLLSVGGQFFRLWDLDKGSSLDLIQDSGVKGAAPRLLALDRAGKRAAVLTPNYGGVELWDLGNQPLKVGKVTHAPRDSIRALALAPDGKRVITCGVRPDEKGAPVDTWVHVWDFDTQEELFRLEGHKAAFYAAAFLPDGKRVVTVAGNELRIWDVEKGSLEDNFYLSTTQLGHAFALSPDGRYLALGGFDGKCRLVDLVQRKELVGRYAGHQGQLHALAFSPDGKVLVAAGRDKLLHLLDGRDLTLLEAVPGSTDEVSALAFTPDGKHLVAGGKDTYLRVWPVLGYGPRKKEDSQGKPPSVHLGAQRSWVNGYKAYDLAFLPDGRQLLMVGSMKVHLWELEKPKPLEVFREERTGSGMGRLAVDQAGERGAAVSVDLTAVDLLDLAGRKLAGRLAHPKGDVVRGLALTPDGKYVLTSGGHQDETKKLVDTVVRVWDFEKQTEIKQLEGHKYYVEGVAVLPGGQRAVSVAGAELRVWDLTTGQTAKQMAVGNGSGLKRLALSKDGRYLALSSFDRSLRVIDLVEMKQIAFAERTTVAEGVAFASDGRYLAAVLGPNDTFVYLHDARTLAELVRVQAAPNGVGLNAVAFTPDGKHLLASSSDGRIFIWPVVDAAAKAE
jgi:WD40 repeat protein